MSHRKSTVGAAAVSIALALTLTGCLPAPQSDAKETIHVTEAVSPPAATPNASPTPQGAATTVAPAPVAAATTATPDLTFTMPDFRGWVLQNAQDKLQSLGSFFMNQEDASDLGRLQINDSNWQVCSQDPAAGAKVDPAQIITLWSVKLTETCP